MSRASQRAPDRPWVLVVDDEPLAARATARLVTTAAEANVSVARDLAAAVHLLRRARTAPSAVLLDFDLGGGVNGATVLAALRQAGCKAPCAFHTGAPARAVAALRGEPGAESPPVFAKNGSDLLGSWLAAALDPSGTAHTSGVRPKAR